MRKQLSQKFINKKQVPMLSKKVVSVTDKPKKPRAVKNKVTEPDKKIAKCINISDEMNYDAWYVAEAYKLEHGKFKDGISIFEFNTFEDASDFFRSNRFMPHEWCVLRGYDFLRQYSFKIIDYRKYMQSRDLKKKK